MCALCVVREIFEQNGDLMIDLLGFKRLLPADKHKMHNMCALLKSTENVAEQKKALFYVVKQKI
jgi:hypothetical protein